MTSAGLLKCRKAQATTPPLEYRGLLHKENGGVRAFLAYFWHNSIVKQDCLFCSLAADKEVIIWENEVAAAFKDIHPRAKVHVLVIPKQHVKNLDVLEDAELAGKMLMAVREVIKTLGLVEANKVLIQGIDIDHLHFHVMSDSRYKG